MSWLKQLAITQHQPVVPGLSLPAVKVLQLSSVDLGFLDHLKAPQLQVLQGIRESSGVTVLLGKAGLSANNQKLITALEKCTGGVLSHCNHLEIDGPCCSGTVVDVLQVLGRCWRPDPSLMHDRALQACTDGKQLADVRDRAPAPAAGGWQLTLSGLPGPRTAMAVLPKGLAHLALKWVQLLVPCNDGQCWSIQPTPCLLQHDVQARPPHQHTCPVCIANLPTCEALLPGSRGVLHKLCCCDAPLSDVVCKADAVRS
jgi:hypothetical protein